MATHKVALITGDGTGPELAAAARRRDGTLSTSRRTVSECRTTGTDG